MCEHRRDLASPNRRAITVKPRMKLLIGLHLLALPLAIFVLSRQTWPQPARPLCIGLAFSDAGFLALWGALGKSWPGLRLIGVTLGMAGLSAFMTFADGIGPEELGTNSSLILLPAGIILFGLLAMRLMRGLALCQRPSVSANVTDLQFSLIHLLMAMTVVACVFSIQKAFDGVSFSEHIRLRSALYVAAVVPSVAAVEWATIWSALGLRHTLGKVLVLAPSGFLVGVFPALLITGDLNWHIYLFWSLAFSCQAFIGTATFLVFRSCGWRLYFKPAGENAIERQYESEGTMSATKGVI